MRIINRYEKVLKGRHTIAQSKRRRSVALGLSKVNRIVRALRIIKEKILLRTKERIAIIIKMIKSNSVRRKFFILNIISPRTVLLVSSIPRATFRIVPPETLPWAKLFWPFRPGRYSENNLTQISYFGEGLSAC